MGSFRDIDPAVKAEVIDQVRNKGMRLLVIKEEERHDRA